MKKPFGRKFIFAVINYDPLHSFVKSKYPPFVGTKQYLWSFSNLSNSSVWKASGQGILRGKIDLANDSLCSPDSDYFYEQSERLSDPFKRYYNRWKPNAEEASSFGSPVASSFGSPGASSFGSPGASPDSYGGNRRKKSRKKRLLRRLKRLTR
jgi:hypothetical protein